MKRFRELSESRQLDIVYDGIDPNWFEWIVENIMEELEGMGFEGVEVNFTGFWSQGDGASFTCKSIYWPRFWKHFRAEIDFQSDQLTEWEEELKTFEWLLGAGGDPEDMVTVKKPISLMVMENNEILTGRIQRTNSRYYHERSTDCYIELEYSWMEDDAGEWLGTHYEGYGREDNKELEALRDYLEVWIDNWMVEKNCEIYQRIQKEYEDHVQCAQDQLMEDDEVWEE